MPTHNIDLGGIGVLVTRPADQADRLCALIEDTGGRPIRFAALSIEAAADRTTLENRLRDLARYQTLVFISRNAVVWGLRAIKEFGIPWAEFHGRIAAVGAGTAQALAEHGITTHIQPAARYGSEALLMEPELNDVRGQRILIFRGTGGREHLRETLLVRGAEVDYAQCYRRTPGGDDPERLLRAWRTGEIGVVTLTSVSGIENLIDAAGSAGRRYLLNTPAVVVSQRQREAALNKGWRVPVVAADDASDAAIVRAVAAISTHIRAPKGM
ncbi:MAG: uroporphyrinogen-III synthase [Gammaproteobacteria bacterium]|nr:uroporphyrinogen-III synthase [Gammaproteobacteria bacterium]